MNTIKKPFQELMKLLEQNKDLKVSEILDQVLIIAESKQASTTTHYDADKKLTHVYCWYHKKWEEVKHYGSKKSNTVTGLNTMCKEGVNAWTKQNRQCHQVTDQVLKLVSAGDITVEQIEETKLTLIAKYKETIIPRADGHGFDSIEDIK